MSLSFATPWLLWGLAALPVIWLLLRAVPPAALRLRFPAVALLLGLKDRESTQARTPWWLLLLRTLALALLIIGFAGPGAKAPAPDQSDRPLLIVADGSWASARDWPARQQIIGQLLDQARARPVALALLSQPPAELNFGTADDAKALLPLLEPAPWAPQPADWLPQPPFDTIWLSDGVAHEARDALRAALQAGGSLRVIEPPSALGVIAAPRETDAGLEIDLQALRLDEAPLRLLGPDPAGQIRALAQADVALSSGAGQAQIDLPHEIRNRLRRAEIAGQGHAGAVRLFGDSLRRPKIGLIAGFGTGEGQLLLDPLHYLRQSLDDTVLIEAPLLAAIEASPDAIILPDLTDFASVETAALSTWVEEGGTLIRFAGPAMAQATQERDPLLPVALREGGRSIGGAMSWGSPKELAPFAGDGLFAGLVAPGEVRVSTQVLAQPSADLPDKVVAQLADGTPLITRATRGQGAIILFHVTANADWSNLPLSGVFPQMLARLVQVSDRAEPPEGGTWRLQQALRADGSLEPVEAGRVVPAEALSGVAGPDLPPGLYTFEGRVWPVDALPALPDLRAAQWPNGVQVDQGLAAQPHPLAGWLIAAGLALLAVDIAASLAVMGRIALVALAVWVMPAQPQAQPAERAIEATRDVPLAYIRSGDAEIDALAEQGLSGLGFVLEQRSSVTPSAPLGVDLEEDELAFYPLLYWIVTPDQALPSPEAIAKLRAYLAAGGMIIFDTRDGGVADLGDTSEAARLRVLAAPLGLPLLEPAPEDHVLRRSFYLLEQMPGRYDGQTWVARSTQGNDGVSPVIVTGNDWIGAWALDEAGNRALPVGRGTTGERQRELAYRTGINLVMYALTGNYKADQIHIPAILDRMGEQ